MAGKLSSYLPTLFFLCKLFHKNLPRDYRNHIHEFLHKFLHKFFHKFLYPSVEVTFHEYTNGYHHRRNTIYAAIENYLSSKSIQQAMSLKANSYKGKNQKLLLSMDDHQEVTDDFRGVSLVWSKESSTSKSYLSVKKRFYKLTFNRKHRDLVTGDYIKHVTEEGNAIELHNRQRKLYANGNGNRMMSRVGSETAYWSHIPFNHPASFHTLAIDPVRKKEIMDDLLYGPPGTGKTTMIAAIANFLNYDIYDLELTAVKNNTDLRKLLIEVSSKAIVVIEDIDCSLGITGQRKKSKTTNSKKKKKESIDDDNDTEQECEDESRSSSSKVTLSGCRFQGFKVLANNYLSIDSHPLFEVIQTLLENTNISPADVAESLMQKSIDEDPETCLNRLIQDLETTAKEGGRMK